eukprot:2256256-Pleurochrysis_carterae.AAC.1
MRARERIQRESKTIGKCNQKIARATAVRVRVLESRAGASTRSFLLEQRERQPTPAQTRCTASAQTARGGGQNEGAACMHIDIYFSRHRPPC